MSLREIFRKIGTVYNYFLSNLAFGLVCFMSLIITSINLKEKWLCQLISNAYNILKYIDKSEDTKSASFNIASLVLELRLYIYF